MKTVRSVGCFIEYQGRFLILRRSPHKPQANTWGLPAGKPHVGETDEQAALREIKEETGYHASASELELLGVYPFDTEDYHLEFPTYRINLSKPITVKHNPAEHLESAWVTPEECYAKSDLIYGFHELLESTGYVQPPAH